MEIMSNPIILLAITFGIYYVARQIQKWTGWIVLNPILITIAALIALLQLTGISYETYEQGGQYIDFWLKPAIVALGCAPLSASWADPSSAVAYPHVATCRLPSGISQRHPDSISHGSIARGHRIAGAQIRHHPHSHGGVQYSRRHTLADGSHRGVRRSLRSHLRFQDTGGVARTKPLLARYQHGHGFTCRRHITRHGEG